MWNYSDIITEMKDIINKCPIKMKTYVYGYINEADLNKKNIYPLVNIEPGEKSWTEYGHLVYSFSVAFLDQRDIVKSENFDKLFGNDNLIDNMNKIDYITNYFQAHLKLQRNAFEITNEIGRAHV